VEDNNDLIKVLFAELVCELGGIAKLDSRNILNNIKANRIKSIGIRVEEDDVIVEVFDEDED
jgi:hypothetical protein